MSAPRSGRCYKHDPLGSPTSAIRLLTLNIYDETHLLRCFLETCELSTRPIYVATSYEWGEVEPQVDIIINGRPLFIRHNLWLFLSVLKVRQRKGALGKDLRLWVDAICINQQDVDERNAQVSIMGRIYRSAASVFAWLGWPTGWNPRLTFDFIKGGSWGINDNCDVTAIDGAGRYFWELPHSEVWRMVLRMCTCRYWSRRWIVQEVLLARDVTIMCGENDLSWVALRGFVQALDGSHNPQPSATMRELMKTIPVIMSRYKAESPDHKPVDRSLRQLLVDFNPTTCEVLHDKVYSLLSLATDGDAIPIKYDCSPQNLLLKVLTQSGWFHGGDVMVIANDLGVAEIVPEKFGGLRDQEYACPSKPFYILEKLVRTHRVLDCLTTQFVLDRAPESNSEVSNTEDGQTELFQNLLDVPGHCIRLKGVKEQEYFGSRGSISAHSSSGDGQSGHERTVECIEWRRAERSKVLVCEDGSVGVVCRDAQPGDLLCNFKKGRKLVIRAEEDKILRTGTTKESFIPIGTAKLVQAPRASGVLLAELRRFLNKILAKTRHEQLYNDFLQLECTPDGSAVTDIMVKEERETFARRIHALKSVLSLLEGVRSDSRSGKAQSNGLLCETSSSVNETTIEGRFDMWDLVELTRNPARTKKRGDSGQADSAGKLHSQAHSVTRRLGHLS
jgi:hypothetical protein